MCWAATPTRHAAAALRVSAGLAALGGSRPSGHIDWIAEQAPAAILRGERFEPPYPRQAYRP